MHVICLQFSYSRIVSFKFISVSAYNFTNKWWITFFFNQYFSSEVEIDVLLRDIWVEYSLSSSITLSACKNVYLTRKVLRKPSISLKRKEGSKKQGKGPQEQPPSQVTPTAPAGPHTALSKHQANGTDQIVGSLAKVSTDCLEFANLDHRRLVVVRI